MAHRMSLLHLLPPEIAHKAALFALKNGLGPRAKPDDPALQVQLLGKTFINPIGLSAGADKKAEALAGWSRMGFGFVEAGTVTLRPRTGNPQPRLWRLGNGHLVNWLGLPGEGLAPFVANLKAFQNAPERKNLVVGVSIASPDGITTELGELAAACAPLADYLTLNVSCPNVSGHAEDDLIKSAQEQVKVIVAAAGGRPVLVKLGPTGDKESLKHMVGSVMEAGASGIVATNTVPWDRRVLLKNIPFNWPQAQGKPVGGYSGPALLDTACWMISEIRTLLGPNAPLIGGGGIQSGADALRMFTAGANLIQLYTGLVYRGSGLLEEIKRGCLEVRR
jgi:dihydroorotate dehydrogenase